MTFKEATEFLGISEYADRIFNSNSMGELFHIDGYIAIADYISGLDKDAKEDLLAIFTVAFDDMVYQAKKTWGRPESVFQHIIPSILEMGSKHEEGVQI